MTKPTFDREHSHSSLNTYTRCSQEYKLKYVEKRKPPLSDRTVALESGTIAHEVLEAWFKMPERDRPKTIEPLLEQWWDRHLKENRLIGAEAAMKALAGDISTLNKRIFYTGTGAVAKSPKSTAEYKKAFEALNIGPRQAEIDQFGARGLPQPWALVSLSATYAETWDILAGWAGLPGIAEVFSVERHVRMKDLALPGGEPFQVKIDLHFQHEDGYTVVCDHKTGGKADEPPHEWEVVNNDQLLKYGWGLEKVDGAIPDKIGIHHVRGKVLVLADFDYSKAMDAVARTQGIVDGIRKGVFVKQTPTDFKSPCYDKFFNSVCPWIPVCHPDFWSAASTQAQQDGKVLGT